MYLLRKNFILASIASVAMAGFLSSSSAYALDGFSFSDYPNSRPSLSELLNYDLTNPFGASADCGATNPDSTISCNESPLPELLFNKSPGENSLYGHDGKGTVFNDADNLINGNPQAIMARRGETISFSTEIDPIWYYDDSEDKPVVNYAVTLGLSRGLTFDDDSMIIKVGEQVLTSEDYAIETQTIPQMEAIQLGFDKLIKISIPWANCSPGQSSYKCSFESFKYTEPSLISIDYSAEISMDAPSEVFGFGVYEIGYVDDSYISHDYAIEQDIYKKQYRATAMLDGNILIRRLDESGNPVAGAKYVVKGVKANMTEAGVYEFSKNGGVEEFITNADGMAIITKAPFGVYTIQEISSPTGHEPVAKTIKQDITGDMLRIEYGGTRYFFNTTDLTNYIHDLDDGHSFIYLSDFVEAAYGRDEDGYGNQILYYDSTLERYMPEQADSLEYVTKDQRGYHLHETIDGVKEIDIDFKEDKLTGKQIAYMYVHDVMKNNSYLRLSPDGKTMTLGMRQDEAETLTFDESSGDYTGELYGAPAIGRKTQTGFQIEMMDTYAMQFTLQEDGAYAIDYLVYVATLEEISDQEILLSTGMPIEYGPEFDHYYMNSAETAQVILRAERPSAYATEFLFNEQPDYFSPDTIPNPQTSDLILKSLAIVALSIAPIAVARKQLSKRTN